jgi:hypothetical protein
MLGIINNQPPMREQSHFFFVRRKPFSGVMIALLLRHQSPEGDGALLAMAPEYVIQHYPNWGCPSGGGKAPKNVFKFKNK